MSIVKDLLFIIPIIVLGFYNLYLIRKTKKDRAFLLSTLKHDIKVPLLAQFSAIKLLENNNTEIFNELLKSCNDTIKMFDMLIYIFEKNVPNNIEIFNPTNIIISAFKKVNDFADLKNINFYYSVCENLKLKTDKKLFEMLICNMLFILISESIKNGKIACITEDKLFNTHITLKCITNKHAGSSKNNNCLFNSVGNNIKYIFCKNIIEKQGWKLVNKLNNNVKNFTIIIPKQNNIHSHILQLSEGFKHKKLQFGKSVL